MRVLPWFVAAALLAAVVTGSLAIQRTPATAGDAQTTTCPTFISVTWVSPLDTGESGNQYGVTVSKNAMSCADATTWAKKLIPAHVGGSVGSHTELKGGAPGYDCVGFPDKTGHAYRGRCEKPGMGDVPGFSWHNYSSL